LSKTELECVGASAEQIDWREPEAVDALIEAEHPFLVINTFSIDSNFEDQHDDYCKNLANACTKIKSRAIQLSDYHVFGLESKTTYFETDKAAPLSAKGEKLAQAEQYFIEQLEQHLIFRLSWLLNNATDNPFTRLMQSFSTHQDINVSKDYFGAPTWQSDVIRVLLGITQQIFSGAENWGIFHYCSNDKCSEFEFAQAIAQTYSDLTPLQSQLLPTAWKDREDLLRMCEPHSAVLSCRRIRNNFGIQTRTWTQGLKNHIREWISQQSNDHNNDKKTPHRNDKDSLECKAVTN
jgi:dTDP-4-dehydrorhamnose reductase